jgi:hypothetical protein
MTQVSALCVRLLKLSNVQKGSQRIGDQNLLSGVLQCFGRPVKPLVPGVFAVTVTVVRTHLHSQFGGDK